MNPHILKKKGERKEKKGKDKRGEGKEGRETIFLRMYMFCRIFFSISLPSTLLPLDKRTARPWLIPNLSLRYCSSMKETTTKGSTENNSVEFEKWLPLNPGKEISKWIVIMWWSTKMKAQRTCHWQRIFKVLIR